ncbi:carboxyl transferase domain-containing protein [Litorivivens sp.]|uniref:carboxyl transferase domain-containing protein n=1 Tax=Litorivivens sp. TaxID=2020868 RepID=UPI0035623464
METISAPVAGVIVSLKVAEGETVRTGQELAVLESMKIQTALTAPAAGVLASWKIAAGETVQKGRPLCRLEMQADASPEQHVIAGEADNPALVALRERADKGSDAQRQEAIAKRHERGFRSARENLDDLCDPGSFVEYGAFAVAAQRQHRDLDDLQRNTSGDGILTGLARVNGAKTVVVVNDYSVLAGTQGYFHHKKLDRALTLARDENLPVVMYTEGGGGRPGDTDVLVQFAGLNVPSFAQWAALKGKVPRIAVNNGYCFAGNAALFGAADIRIATESSCIGMAGPAMIEGGGLGQFSPKQIGPIEVQRRNGVVDVVARDEAEATALAKQALSFFQGRNAQWQAADQSSIGEHLPRDRRFAYDVRKVIDQLCDSDSVLELKPAFGAAVVTALARIEGQPCGLLASNCKHLGGAIDAEAADKCADFIDLCSQFELPIVSLVDTPGFMVGPDSESEAAVWRMSRLFASGSQSQSTWVAIFLRRAYGLGAMALAGGSFARPVYAAAWPTGEFGAMGLEGAVKLGFKKQLEAVADATERQALFDQLLAQAYDQGRAIEAASYLEIDAVIEPGETRALIAQLLSEQA